MTVSITTPLTDEEARVLGCLIEKAVTTPEYYPLTLNACTSACNQTSNRNPVVHYSDGEVQTALLALREKGLARTVSAPGSRGPKQKHVLEEALALDAAGVAVLAILLLRGPQTVGEIKGRTERMHGFGGLGAVESTLEDLAGRSEPLVVRLPRQPGQKEERWVHLLSGMPDLDALSASAAAAAESAWSGGAAIAPSRPAPRDERLTQLEADLTATRDELARLRAEFDEFKRSFE